MVHSKPLYGSLAFFAFFTSVGCSTPVEINVQLVEPCDQTSLSSVELLTFVPRGEGLDSAGLSATFEVSAGASRPLELPLVRDFQLIVEGYADRASFEQQVLSGLGLSTVTDLSSVEERISIRVPFAETDRFHRTTRLDASTCSTLSADRFGHTATYLPDSGRVLIVGGVQWVPTNGGGVRLDFPRAIEIYDPRTGAFEVVAELRVGGARAFHSATLLDGDRVLIAGGQTEESGQQVSLRSAFIVDASDASQVVVASEGLVM
ncbi:MAG: kelch repeat-containing protein, partial [Myxococcota bacterium]